MFRKNNATKSLTNLPKMNKVTKRLLLKSVGLVELEHIYMPTPVTV